MRKSDRAVLIALLLIAITLLVFKTMEAHFADFSSFVGEVGDSEPFILQSPVMGNQD